MDDIQERSESDGNKFFPHISNNIPARVATFGQEATCRFQPYGREPKKDVGVLKEFDMSIFSDIHHSYNVIIVGRRGKGKTHLITDILKLQETHRVKKKTIISGMKAELDMYSDNFNDAVLHDEYNDTFVVDAIDRHMKLYKNDIKNQRETNIWDPATQTSSTIVFDNSLYDNSWYSNKCIRQLLMNGKVWRFNMIISCGYPIGIPPVLRVTIDCFFIFNDSDFSYRKRIWEKYLFEYLSFEMFDNIMLQLINPYECLVVKHSYKSKKIEDNIFVILFPNVVR